MSPAKDQEYFSDGMSEELLNLLSKVNDLKVISRTSSFSFKGKNVEVRKIGKVLGVANVLEGSVGKSGSTIRVSAQWGEGERGTHLWSET
jgi:TolB-like protein